MPSFSFRIRFRFPKWEGLNVDAPSLVLSAPDSPVTITLKSREPPKSIKDSRSFVIGGGGWPSEQEAQIYAQRCKDALALSLVRLRGAVDFEERRTHGVITSAGLQWMQQVSGQRVLPDQPGIIVFETEPHPVFAAVSADVAALQPPERFKQVFLHALDRPVELTNAERLAFDLYNAASFEISPHARFLTLVMAVEALLNPLPREAIVRAHVENLLRLTEESDQLPKNEQNSLCGSLRWLLNESIGQAGRRLSRERLGEKVYAGMTAPEFFSHVYTLRSNLVHGNEQQPSLAQVNSAGSDLRQFVSDLLTPSLAEIEV